MAIKVDPIEVYNNQFDAYLTLNDFENKEGLFEPEEIDEDGDSTYTERTVEHQKEMVEDARKSLTRVSVDNLKLPSAPLVRFTDFMLQQQGYEEYNKDDTYVILYEITQMHGHVGILNLRTKEIIPVVHSGDLEMLTPDEV